MSTTGGRSASAENGTAIGERVHQDDKSRRFVKKDSGLIQTDDER